MQHDTVLAGLCIECALRHHDFKEILARGKDDDLFPESPLPAAWIDGRRCRVLIPIGNQTALCHECQRNVPTIFLPIPE